MKYSHCTQLSIAFIIYSAHARASECLQCTGLLQYAKMSSKNFTIFQLKDVERLRTKPKMDHILFVLLSTIKISSPSFSVASVSWRNTQKQSAPNLNTKSHAKTCHWPEQA